jgi:hypothetical protein
VANLEFRLRSDATRLQGETPCILVHVLSDALTWGLGFTQAIDARWPERSLAIERRLRNLEPRPVLGDVLWTTVEPGIELAHMVVERSRGIAAANLDLMALSTSLALVADRALALGAVVHAPALGTGLTGARWLDVESAIRTELIARNVSVVTHCLGSQPPQ